MSQASVYPQTRYQPSPLVDLSSEAERERQSCGGPHILQHHDAVEHPR
jgi:hypothetical protein